MCLNCEFLAVYSSECQNVRVEKRPEQPEEKLFGAFVYCNYSSVLLEDSNMEEERS